MSYRFWLVQRLEPERHRDGSPSGIVCEYMGSAEYEFDTVPKARQRLTNCDDLITVERDITLEGQIRSVYFLGSLATIERKIAAMQSWIDEGLRCKELSMFDCLFTGKSWDGSPLRAWYCTVVWWGLEEDLVWALEERHLITFIEQRQLQVVPFGRMS